MRIALFQPDVPQNTGNIYRLASCLGVCVDVIEPTGFVMDDKKLERSVMDYYKYLKLKRHIDWLSFHKWVIKNKFRLILLTTKGSLNYYNYSFKKNDILLLGRESAGVPEEVHNIADERIYIPMKKGLRSLNVSSAASIVLGEAVKQLKII